VPFDSSQYVSVLKVVMATPTIKAAIHGALIRVCQKKRASFHQPDSSGTRRAVRRK
jgi:hypothetical protein